MFSLKTYLHDFEICEHPRINNSFNQKVIGLCLNIYIVTNYVNTYIISPKILNIYGCINIVPM